jgi:predicted RNA binding protein YcfA (HicA-like mRNA interferase family)
MNSSKSGKNGTTVTFATFDQFLRDLGFSQTTVPGSHDSYEHSASGTVLMTRLHKPTDPVPHYTLASTEETLVWRGLVSPEEFHRMARQTAVRRNPV